MYLNCRTDLAVEDYEKDYQDKITTSEIGGVMIQKIAVDETDAKQFKKREGIYYTLTTDSIVELNHDEGSNVSKAICNVLEDIYEEYGLTLDSKILVVGLGNDTVTPDSLGPMAIKNVFVTKHLYDLNRLEKNLGIVSALAPGVMGQTGMETSDIIKAVVTKTKPDLVLVVDALASRSLNRVNRTIQITTAGINPGSGVGNKRKEISERTLKVPVIAIGVPTVVDVASIFDDALTFVEQANNQVLKKPNVDYDARQILNESNRNYMVTAKEIDEIIRMLSDVISKGINLSIHNIEQYE